jgi:YgiT-type zinc finger domain-containing protein
MMEPIMCPFCGGAELIEEEESEIEIEDEYWVIYHWRCTDCGEAFDKVITQPLSDAFEDVKDDEEGPLWS